MKFIPRKESRAERKSKSSRSTEMGIAGHQAAMNALNTHNRKTPRPVKDAGPMPRADEGQNNAEMRKYRNNPMPPKRKEND
jgi:hypothetical protein